MGPAEEARGSTIAAGAGGAVGVAGAAVFEFLLSHEGKKAETRCIVGESGGLSAVAVVAGRRLDREERKKGRGGGGGGEGESRRLASYRSLAMTGYK